MSTPTATRRAERKQVRHAYNGTRAGSLFRGTESRSRDPTVRRSLGLKVAGGVRIDVYVRCRPVNDMEKDNGDPCVVQVDSAKRTVAIKPPTALKRGADTFTFDATFGPSSTQAEVYNQVAGPVVEEVCRGMNCCVMAYGQTGTGKTFTMAGDVSKAGKERDLHGLIPRAVKAIFEANTVTDEFTGKEVARGQVTVSFLEVYNEQLEDLLALPAAGAGGPTDDATPPLKLVDDRDNGTVCQHLTEVAVEDVDQVMTMIEEAQLRSHVSATKLNKQSNRAHRIFTITATFGEARARKVGRLTLVDLAGSECVGRSGAVDMTAKEAGTINKSLLTLGRVIQALAANERHVPYRDSKLTRLLQEALGGVCKTSIIATISPAASGAEESLSTLRYAQSAMDALNIEQLPKARRLELQLKQMVAAYDQLAKESERHVRALQRSVAVAMTERRQLELQHQQLASQLKTAVEEKRAVEAHNRDLERALADTTAERDRLAGVLKSTRSDLLDTVVDRDVTRRALEQTRDHVDHVTRERDAVLKQGRFYLSAVQTRTAEAASQATDAAGSGEAAIGKHYAAATRELADLHESVSQWAEEEVGDQLDKYARDTEFVAEVTRSLNTVDKFLKDTVREAVSALTKQQAAIDERLARERDAAQSEHRRLVDRVSELLASHAAASDQRLTDLAASSRAAVTRHAGVIEDASKRTGERLVTVASSASKFHSASESTQQRAKARSLSRVQAAANTITAAQGYTEQLKVVAVDSVHDVEDKAVVASQDCKANCLAGIAATEDITQFPMPPITRRTVDDISATNPDGVPRSLSRALSDLMSPYTGNDGMTPMCSPTASPPAATPVSLDGEPRQPSSHVEVEDAHHAPLISPHARARGSVDMTSLLDLGATNKATGSGRGGNQADTNSHAESKDDEDEKRQAEKAAAAERRRVSTAVDEATATLQPDDDNTSPARAELRRELDGRADGGFTIKAYDADVVGESLSMLGLEKPLLPDSIRTDLSAGSSMAAPSPQALHQILRDNLGDAPSTTSSPAVRRSTSPISYAARKEQLNRRLEARLKERRGSRPSSSLSHTSSTSTVSKSRSYTSLTGGKFTAPTATSSHKSSPRRSRTPNPTRRSTSRSRLSRK